MTQSSTYCTIPFKEPMKEVIDLCGADNLYIIPSLDGKSLMLLFRITRARFPQLEYCGMIVDHHCQLQHQSITSKDLVHKFMWEKATENYESYETTLNILHQASLGGTEEVQVDWLNPYLEGPFLPEYRKHLLSWTDFAVMCNKSTLSVERNNK